MREQRKKRKQDDCVKRYPVVVPYVERVSELVAMVFRKHRMPVVMKPVKIVKRLLVHPKDKKKKEETAECVFNISCCNYDKPYVDETSRKFRNYTEGTQDRGRS